MLPYKFEPHDVLQVTVGGVFKDLMTLRTSEEAEHAMPPRAHGHWDGHKETLRIVRPSAGGTCVYALHDDTYKGKH